MNKMIFAFFPLIYLPFKIYTELSGRHTWNNSLADSLEWRVDAVISTSTENIGGGKALLQFTLLSEQRDKESKFQIELNKEQVNGMLNSLLNIQNHIDKSA